MRFLWTRIDPVAMKSALGLKIAECFFETHSKPEHERINYEVTANGVKELATIVWVRRVRDEAAAPQQDCSSAHSSDPQAQVSRLHEQPTHERHKQPQALGAPTEPIPSEESSGPWTEIFEPDVLICFEASDFVAYVLRDQLRSVFRSLYLKYPTSRPHILVHRLDAYLRQRENEDFQAAMKEQLGGNTKGKGRTKRKTREDQRSSHVVDIDDMSERFCRSQVDEFLAFMSVAYPQVGFRDVATVEEGASHALAVTRAVARRYIAESELANVFSRQCSGGNKVNQTTAKLLAAQPLVDSASETFMNALGCVPSIGPQIAHALAIRFGSLGNLIEYCLDPIVSGVEKQKELENIPRSGSGRGTRIGPVAAKAVLEILCGEDERMIVYEDSTNDNNNNNNSNIK